MQCHSKYILGWLMLGSHFVFLVWRGGEGRGEGDRGEGDGGGGGVQD